MGGGNGKKKFFALLSRGFDKKKFFVLSLRVDLVKKIFFALAPRGFGKKKFFMLSLHTDSGKKNFLKDAETSLSIIIIFFQAYVPSHPKKSVADIAGVQLRKCFFVRAFGVFEAEGIALCWVFVVFQQKLQRSACQK